MERHEPIDRLCQFMSELPASTRQTLVDQACIGLGLRRTPTGVEYTDHTPLKHLFWDYDSDGLRTRMVELMDEHGLTPEFLVLGVLARIEAWLRVMSDPAHTAFAKLDKERTLEAILAQKDLPEYERTMSDEVIDDLVTKLRDGLPPVEQMEAEAAECLRVFLPARAERFSFAFWHEYNRAMLRLGPP